jgi:hypothetical protein
MFSSFKADCRARNKKINELFKPPVFTCDLDAILTGLKNVTGELERTVKAYADEPREDGTFFDYLSDAVASVEDGSVKALAEM